MGAVGRQRQIKIIQTGSTTGVGGFRKPTEQVVWAGWANVRQANGYREFVQGLAKMGTVKEFEIRYNKPIKYNANTRLVYDGKFYTIASIEPKNENRFWWIIRAAAISE